MVNETFHPEKTYFPICVSVRHRAKPFEKITETPRKPCKKILQMFLFSCQHDILVGDTLLAMQQGLGGQHKYCFVLYHPQLICCSGI